MTHWEYTTRGRELLQFIKFITRNKNIFVGTCDDIGYLGQLHIYLDTEQSPSPNEKYLRINLNGSMNKRRHYILRELIKYYEKHNITFKTRRLI